jgi:dihydrofolate reductase
LPNGALPNRRNIVISGGKLKTPPESLPENTSLFVKKTTDEALEFAKNDEKVFIIGGESVYRATIDIADTLYITEIDAEFKADRFFPEIDPKIWQEKERLHFQNDKLNRYNFSFIIYEKIA